MPILTYFAVTVPLLLGGLLAVSAYLEPEKAPTTAELIGIPSANAHVVVAPPSAPAHQPSEFDRLSARPLGH